MGVICVASTISDGNIDLLIQNPNLIFRHQEPDDPDLYLAAVKPHWAISLFLTIIGRKPPTLTAPDLEFLPGEGEYEDIDKSWDGLNYLLTKIGGKKAASFNFLSRGDEHISSDNFSEGSITLFRTHKAQDILKALSGISHDDLRAAYDAKAMKKLYLGHLWTDEKRGLKYCIENFDDLKKFIDVAVRGQLGFLLYFS